MQRSSEQPLVGEERYVTTLITAAKETTGKSDYFSLYYRPENHCIYSNGPARFTTRQSLSCSKWCICCSTIFSELVQNTLNWYNCNCTGLFLSTV